MEHSTYWENKEGNYLKYITEYVENGYNCIALAGYNKNNKLIKQLENNNYFLFSVKTLVTGVNYKIFKKPITPMEISCRQINSIVQRMEKYNNCGNFNTALLF